MSGFSSRAIYLGSLQHVHKHKVCGKCEKEKPPEGGIDLGTRWVCAQCWVKRSTLGSLKQNRKPS